MNIKRINIEPQIVNLKCAAIPMGSVFTVKSKPGRLLLRTYDGIVDLADPVSTWGKESEWDDVKFKNAHVVVEE